MVTIPLSLTEVKKFHGNLFEQVIGELKRSDTKHKNAKPDKIQWAYSYEVVSDNMMPIFYNDNTVAQPQTTDVREMRREVDRKIRLAKLKHLNNVSKATLWKKATPPKESTEEISQQMERFFGNVITLSLMMKVDNYERFYPIEKTSLFESKVKEDIEHGKFVF